MKLFFLQTSARTTTISGLLVAVILLFGSCGGEEEEKKVSEGIISYTISYPYYEGSSIMIKMFPDEMILKFKNGKYKIEVQKGGVFKTILVADSKSKSITNQLYFGPKKIATELNEAEVGTMIEEFPVPIYMETGEQDTVAGYLCDKTIAVFSEISQKEVILYHTKDIALKESNWCNPYKEIPGVLLQYEVERYGLRMRFTANNIEKKSVKESEFKIEQGYKRVSLEKMNYELEQIFNSLVN
jgi:hypothetical protein